MVMCSPLPTCHQVCTIPYFPNTNTTNNHLTITTTALPLTKPHAHAPTNPPSPLKHTNTNTNTINGLVHRITSLLSSSNTKTHLLQILLQDAQFQTISDFNHLLMALFLARQPHICLTLFAKLPSYQLVPDSCTYSILIRCHCEINQLDEAKKALDAILQNGFQPNPADVTVLINSLCKKGRIQKAVEVSGLMATKTCNFKPNVQICNCLLKGLCYVGKVEEALEILMNMKDTTPLLKPDIYSYTAVMDGLCKVGRSDEAMELLNEAVEMGLIPSVVTFNTLLQGYSREGRPMEGVALLKLMKKHGCVAGYISYNTVLHGLLKWNEIGAALGIYKEMVSIGIQVDVRMMGTLVRRLCKKSGKERGLIRDAVQVFEKMKQRELMIDQTTIEVMIQSLCRRNKIDEAFENLNDMVRMGYSPKAITFDKVIQGLCARGRMEAAVSTLQLMLANGGVPNRISYHVLIKELNAHGRLLCASNLLGTALKQGIVPNRSRAV